MWDYQNAGNFFKVWGWEGKGSTLGVGEGGLVVKKYACLASLESARFGAWVLKRETTSPS